MNTPAPAPADRFRYAVLSTDGRLTVAEIPNYTGAADERLAALQDAVGGDVELIRGAADGLFGWINEDGLALGLSLNPAAVTVLHALGVALAVPVVVGPVAFTGSARGGRAAASLADDQLSALRSVLSEWAIS
jgi:hypothetical protein